MATKRKSESVVDQEYHKRLDAIVDELFQRACNKQMEWSDLARESGLSRHTVEKLGQRVTRLPQYRTIELLAKAVGGRLAFSASERATGKIRISWKLDDFRHKKRRKWRAA